MKLSGKVGNGPMNKRLNFGGDSIHGADPDPDPDRDTGKTCLGRSMHCPSASSPHIWACVGRLRCYLCILYRSKLCIVLSYLLSVCSVSNNLERRKVVELAGDVDGGTSVVVKSVDVSACVEQ